RQAGGRSRRAHRRAPLAARDKPGFADLISASGSAALIALMTCRAVEDEPHVDVVRPAVVDPHIAADSPTHHDALEFPMEKSCWSTLIGSVGLVVDQRFAGGALRGSSYDALASPARSARSA